MDCQTGGRGKGSAKRARELADKINASYSSIYPIWDGSAKRADLATLNKLCNLLDVPVGMFLAHLPDAEIVPLPDLKEKPGAKSPASKKGKSSK